MADPEVRVLWRLVDSVEHVGNYDMDGEWCSSTRRVRTTWIKYHVVRETPKGMWIQSGEPGDKAFTDYRWVANTTRYVASTKAEAHANAVRKRKYHVRMCKQRLEDAESRLRVLGRGVIPDCSNAAEPVMCRQSR